MENKIPQPKTIARHYIDGKLCDYPAEAVFSAINSFDYNYNSVKVLVELGEISLSEDLYIDGTTIRSRAARRKIYWRKTAERFSSLANEKLQEALSELTDQIDEPPEDESAREGHTDISPEEARKIAKRIKEKVDLSQNKEVDKKLQEIEGLCKRNEKHDEIIKKCEDRCGICPGQIPSVVLCMPKKMAMTNDRRPTTTFKWQHKINM